MPTPSISSRSLEGSGLSTQSIAIIASFSGAAVLVLAYFLYRSVHGRCRQAARPHPLPPVQPLAHHREILALRVEESLSPRPDTWYEPTRPATRSIGSKASLLGSQDPPLSSPAPSNQFYSASDIESGPDTNSIHQHLPLPTPSYRRPGSSSSYTSSDASCASPQTTPASLDSTTPAPPRQITDLRSGNAAPSRRRRPNSMSSTGSRNTHHTLASRASRQTLRGAPHAADSQIQIILPAPLAPFNSSRDSLALSSLRYHSGSYDRRSVADSWLIINSNPNLSPTGEYQYDETSPRKLRRRPASMSSPGSPTWTDEQHLVPPVPPVPQLPAHLQVDPSAHKSSRSVVDSRWIPSHQTVREEEDDSPSRNLGEAEKKGEGG